MPKSFRLSCTALTFLCASILPSAAATFTLTGQSASQLLAPGDSATFSDPAVTTSPFFDAWFFNINAPTQLTAFATAGNSPPNIDPMALAIWRDDGSIVGAVDTTDTLDTIVKSVSGTFSIDLITALTSPGNYYVSISGPFTAASSGAVSGTLAIAPSPVPLPPAVALFGSALAGLALIARRRRKASRQPV